MLPEGQPSAIQRDYASILAIARVYERMARDEIARLDGERPNDPVIIEQNARQRDLLTLLADGFAQIAAALEAFASDPNEPVLVGRAQEVVNSVAEQITAWLKANAADLTDWGIRLSIMTGSIATLGWAGANMTIATGAACALVGGPKVVAVVARRKAKHKRKK